MRAMKAVEIYNKLVSEGQETAASELKFRTMNFEKKSLFIGDGDDVAYETDLAFRLMDLTKWANRKNGFVALFN